MSVYPNGHEKLSSPQFVCKHPNRLPTTVHNHGDLKFMAVGFPPIVVMVVHWNHSCISVRFGPCSLLLRAPKASGKLSGCEKITIYSLSNKHRSQKGGPKRQGDPLTKGVGFHVRERSAELSCGGPCSLNRKLLNCLNSAGAEAVF